MLLIFITKYHQKRNIFHRLCFLPDLPRHLKTSAQWSCKLCILSIHYSGTSQGRLGASSSAAVISSEMPALVNKAHTSQETKIFQLHQYHKYGKTDSCFQAFWVHIWRLLWANSIALRCFGNYGTNSDRFSRSFMQLVEMFGKSWQWDFSG
mgnify:CR=1 FL=1